MRSVWILKAKPQNFASGVICVQLLLQEPGVKTECDYI
jgi:hypothetical protein